MILRRILQCDDDDFEDDDVGDDYPGWWWLNWCWKIKAPSDGDHQPSKPFCSKEELRRRNQNWKGVVLPIWIYVTVYWGDWANIYRIPRTWLHCTKIMIKMPGIWMNATFFCCEIYDMLWHLGNRKIQSAWPPYKSSYKMQTHSIRGCIGLD